MAAARLGAEVALVGALGDDAFGRQLRAGLAAESVQAGIDVRAARRQRQRHRLDHRRRGREPDHRGARRQRPRHPRAGGRRTIS
ncbi:PfkB family carbohydrate kinase [Rhodanobacter lindaniclasticus]